MKRILILSSLVLAASVYALTKVTVPYTFSASTAARASQVNANFDTLDHALDKVVDTVNQVVVRFNTTSTSHDSVLKYIRIDSVRSNPDIDSISGLKFVDSINTKKVISADTLRGLNLRVTDTVLTKGARATASIRGDSILSDKGIRSVGSLKSDSVLSDKGIRAVGSIRGDSVLSDKGIRAVGSVRGDSILSDKGIRASGKIVGVGTGVGVPGIYASNGTTTADAGIKGLTIDSDGLRFGTSAVSAGFGAIGSNGTTTGITFVTHNGSAWAERMRIHSNANVGIDTATPAYKLHVNGQFKAQDSIITAKGFRNDGYSRLGGNANVKFWTYSHTVTAGEDATFPANLAPQISITAIDRFKVRGLSATHYDVVGDYLYGDNQATVKTYFTHNDSVGVYCATAVDVGDTITINFFTIE